MFQILLISMPTKTSLYLKSTVGPIEAEPGLRGYDTLFLVHKHFRKTTKEQVWGRYAVAMGNGHSKPNHRNVPRKYSSIVRSHLSVVL